MMASRSLKLESCSCNSRCLISRPTLSAGSRLLPRWQSVVSRSRTETTDSTSSSNSSSSSSTPPSPSQKPADLERDLAKVTRQVAGTFAPRPSTATKNPAYKGSVLYNIFEYQAWLSLVVGGLLSFNVLFPTDQPSIARLMGMWSIWMFTVPSLRAKQCEPGEKDALNLLFLLIPLLNVAIPFATKSFPLIFTADVIALLGVYAWKGVWQEVYGLPIGNPAPAPVAPKADESQSK